MTNLAIVGANRQFSATRQRVAANFVPISEASPSRWCESGKWVAGVGVCNPVSCHCSPNLFNTIFHRRKSPRRTILGTVNSLYESQVFGLFVSISKTHLSLHFSLSTTTTSTKPPSLPPLLREFAISFLRKQCIRQPDSGLSKSIELAPRQSNLATRMVCEYIST